MGDYRGRGAEWLLRAGLSKLASAVHDRGRAPLLCLAYHRVLPLPDPARYPFDLELISASPEQFEQQMAYLRMNFDPVPLSAVVDHVESGARLPRRPVVVTFDDGFDDNLHFAGPSLRQHGIQPTIFLATDMVGAQVRYWFELAMYFMMRFPPRTLEVPNDPERLPVGDDEPSRRRSGARLQRALMVLPETSRATLLARWQNEHAAYIDTTEFQRSRLLDWPTIREMARTGYEFGSHSVTHSLLSTLQPDALDTELAASRATLERELQRPVRTLAYPIGKEFAYTRQVKEAARRAGYALALAYTSGINWLGAMDLFAINRQNIERGQSLLRFKAMVRFPAWVRW